MTDTELFARQDALQHQASAVLMDLDLIALLATVGRPIITGSVALRLMVARDIDVTTLCPALDAVPIFDLGRRLATHPRVRGLAFRDDTGRWNTDLDYPDGLYWKVAYIGDDDLGWTLDLWFLLEGTSQFDLEHLVTMPERLTPEIRAAILRIKEATIADPRLRKSPSYQIYEAVLDHGIRTVEDYARHATNTPGW